MVSGLGMSFLRRCKMENIHLWERVKPIAPLTVGLRRYCSTRVLHQLHLVAIH